MGCAGLPEEMRITEAALAEGHAVVALSSQDRTGNRCWDTGWPPENSADIPKVKIPSPNVMKLSHSERSCSMIVL